MGLFSRKGTRVAFQLSKTIPMSPDRAWSRLSDWSTHGEWIPMTRMEIDPADPNRFTAWSGLGKLALEDRMQVVATSTDSDTKTCRVAKLGPVLVGEAEFAVSPAPSPDHCVIQWREDVNVPFLPSFLAPVAAWLGKSLFGASINRMAKKTPA
jgi:hypothetical protein